MFGAIFEAKLGYFLIQDLLHIVVAVVQRLIWYSQSAEEKK